ncbi:heparin lyase I family protein [Phenylobacterium deserti]|uniref:Polysaccharide lyase family 7 protein n=1 Tax=Phenylobacterium deserti TaxID=1914756 RepID=A0A328AT64_9CAUL|nr:heparin lyase I family protein [Phenylobacterium deserti]RAK58140.1 hypothetical protein DJ018_09605 [Phenylobacterium deserti]
MLRSRTTVIIAAAVVASLGLGSAAASVVIDKYAIGVHDNPLRLLGLVQANFDDGCAPSVNPIACRVAGRAWRLQSSGAPWSARAEGDNGYRFEIRPGDYWAKDARKAHPVERTELSDLARMPLDKDIWLAFTLEVEPGVASTSEWVNLGQLHATADRGEPSVSPPWVQRLLPNDRFQVEVRHTQDDPIKAAPPPVVIYEEAKLERGKPHRFVYRFRISQGPNGLAQMWRDGVLVADYRGPIGYRDKLGPYFKFGVYRAPAARGERLAARYTNVTLGSNPPPDRLPATPLS